MVPHRKITQPNFGLMALLYSVLFLFVGINLNANTFTVQPPGCSTPSQAPQDYTITDLQGNQANLTIDRGNGQNLLIIARAGSAVNAGPIDDDKYNASSNYGKGAEIGTGNYAIKAGGGNTFFINDLEGNTTYYFRAYEYNKSGSKFCYGNSYLEFSFTTSCTKPENKVTNAFISGETNGTTLTWTNGDGEKRLVIVRPDNSSSTSPNDDQAYTADSNYGSGASVGQGFAVYNGNSNSCTINNLASSTYYRADFFEYNEGQSGSICYGYIYSFRFKSGCGELSTTVTNPGNGTFNTNGGSINCTRGTGERLIIIAKEGSPVDATPLSDGNYSANSTFGNGSEIGNGNFVVYDGTGSSVYVGGLSEGTSYHFAYFEYDEGININCYGPAVHHSVATKCDHPSVKSSNGIASNVQPYKASINWNPGEGNAFLVVARPNGSSKVSPSQNQAYSANSEYGSGDALGGGFVVYNGNGTAVNLTGLSHSTTYAIDIYDYNQSDPFICYNYSGAYTFTFGTLEPTVFEWNQSTGSNSFNTSSNWTPARTHPKVTDTLLFNLGGTVQIFDMPDDTVTHLAISNGTNLEIDNSDSTRRFVIRENGSIAIDANSSLKLTGTKTLFIELASNAQALISGDLLFSNTPNHCLIASESGAINFLSGSTCTVLPSYSGCPFGESPQNTNTVVFQSGSTFLQKSNTSDNVFGRQSPSAVISFESGSRYFHQSSAVLQASGRTYGNLIYDYNASATLSNGNLDFVADTLIVKQGTLSFRGNTKVNIKGKIQIDGGDSLVFDPILDQDIEFNGLVSEMANNGGNMRFGKKARLVIKSGNNVNLTGNLLIEGGILNESSAQLTVGPGDSLRLGGLLENQGTITLEDDASLIQGDASGINNTGTVQITRNIPDGASDNSYYFWSSPVTGGNGGKIGSGGVLTGSVMYKYNMGGSTGNDYVWVGGGEIMEPGRGYAVAGTNSATFYGTPNNGNIAINIHKNEGESYNIVGNPYPSAINGQTFMDQNEEVIDGTIYLWSFNTNDNSGEKQYISVNEMGSNSTTDPNQNLSTTNIASCQGFFVQTKSTLPQGDAQVLFKNNMRNGYNNAFKSGDKYHFEEKNWIYAKNEQNDTAAFLYAIVEEATEKFDANMDAETFSSYFRIGVETSQAEQSILAVPPSTKPRQYPLTLNISKTGMHELGLITKIYSRESEFQPILIDTENHESVELDEESYAVYLEEGLHVGRFYLMFTRAKSPDNGGGTTAIGDKEQQASISYRGNGLYRISSNYSLIERTDVLDASGKLLYSKTLKANESLVDLNNFSSNNLILRVFVEIGRAHV